jgi:hypothetical protein
LVITEDNSLILEMYNEDYTCGGPLNYILQEFNEVIFSGITKPDFLQKCMLIKIKVDKKFKLIDILIKGIDICIDRFNIIKSNLEYLHNGKTKEIKRWYIIKRITRICK